jgi:hypothetical protein
LCPAIVKGKGRAGKIVAQEEQVVAFICDISSGNEILYFNSLSWLDTCEETVLILLSCFFLSNLEFANTQPKSKGLTNLFECSIEWRFEARVCSQRSCEMWGIMGHSYNHEGQRNK